VLYRPQPYCSLTALPSGSTFPKPGSWSPISIGEKVAISISFMGVATPILRPSEATNPLR